MVPSANVSISTSGNDIDTLVMISTDAADIGITFMAVVCVVLVLMASYVVQYGVGLLFNICCATRIRFNNAIRNNTRNIMRAGLTSGRVEAFELIVSWLFLIIVSAGILLFFECRITFLGSAVAGSLMLMWGVLGRSNWIWSFLLRFDMLYSDTIRVGDYVVLYNRDVGIVQSMWAMTVQIRIKSVTDVEDAVVKHAMMEASTPAVTASDSLEDRPPSLVHAMMIRMGITMHKSVPYTDLMDPLITYIGYLDPEEEKKIMTERSVEYRWR